MTRLYFDASAYSNLRRGHAGLVDAAEWIGMPSVVIGELWTGFLRGKRRVENIQQLDDFPNQADGQPLSAKVYLPTFNAEFARPARDEGSAFVSLRGPGGAGRHSVLGPRARSRPGQPAAVRAEGAEAAREPPPAALRDSQGQGAPPRGRRAVDLARAEKARQVRTRRRAPGRQITGRRIGEAVVRRPPFAWPSGR